VAAALKAGSSPSSKAPNIRYCSDAYTRNASLLENGFVLTSATFWAGPRAALYSPEFTWIVI
jgi:hypothetical protein